MGSVLERIDFGRVNPIVAYVVGLGLGWSLHQSFTGSGNLTLDVMVILFILTVIVVGEVAVYRRS